MIVAGMTGVLVSAFIPFALLFLLTKLHLGLRM
jgi:hypothetical protein